MNNYPAYLHSDCGYSFAEFLGCDDVRCEFRRATDPHGRRAYSHEYRVTSPRATGEWSPTKRAARASYKTALGYTDPRHELTITHGARSYRVAYTRDNTSDDLLAACRRRARAIAALTGTTTIGFPGMATDGGVIGDWVVAFSERTCGQARRYGELPELPDPPTTRRRK